MATIIESKRALTYSLLAHINNYGNLAKGQLDIFIPVVKKSLQVLSSASVLPKGESIQEIGDAIFEHFGIDFPLPVLRNILKIIAKEINTPEKKVFEVFNDDGFILHKYIFEEFDEIIEQSKKELFNLQLLFKKFCEINNVKQTQGLLSFIEKNKISISTYLANKNVQNGNDYSIEAKFVDYFRNTSIEIYNQIRNLYLGAILTSYLEYQPSDANMDVDLLLDTNFIISLIDLNTIESTKTCRKLIEIGDTLGYKFHVLSDTIEEAQGLLHFKAENYDKSVIQRYVNREDVYNACNRLNYNKTDLERISDNLPEQLVKKYGITIIPHTEKYRNIARFSKEYRVLKKYRNSDKSALHDAMCITYVKEIRKNRVIHKFEDVNCWWVNNSITHDFENEDISALLSTENGNHLPEMIKVDDLINILWLTCPGLNNLDTTAMLDMGLSSLIAYTFNQSLPKAKIIKELDDNIQKYRNESISDRDILMLATRVANGQIRDIEKINAQASSDTQKFNERIKEEALKQEKIEKEQSRTLEAIVLKLNEKIQELQEHKQKIDETSLRKIEQEIDNTRKEYETQLLKKDNEIAQLKSEKEKRENELKEKKREKYIKKQVRIWRVKTILLFILFTAITVLGIVWIVKQGKMDDLNSFLSSKIGAWALTLIGGFIDVFLLKALYDKTINYSNIVSFKNNITFPDELK